MQLKFKQKIEVSWYQQTRWWNWLLLPFSWLFIFFSSLRRGYYQLFSPQKMSAPIIVVGNITTGGTGKTPLVIYLAQLLQQHGYRPGIVSRGYAREQTECTVVTVQSDPRLVGDEPVLLAQRTQVPVVVGRKRVAAVQQLLKNFTCNIIISDDGLQHYALARDIEIAVVDGQRRLGNGWRLPAGPLRETKQRLQTVDFVVSTGSAEKGEYELQLRLSDLHNMYTAQQIPLTMWRDKKVFAVAGIGNNQRFFDVLIAHGLKIIPCAFADHHAYQSSDFTHLTATPQIPIIMTEKDAVKCTAFATEQFWCLPVTAQLSTEFVQKILGKVSRLIL